MIFTLIIVVALLVYVQLVWCWADALLRLKASQSGCNHSYPPVSSAAKKTAHCGGAFKGEGRCWLSVDCLRLNLTSVTGHSINVNEV